MKPFRIRPRIATAKEAGFTIIEMMITVAIVGVLAAIALPMYFSYIQRSRIIEATTALGDLRSQMEKYYMDNRTYVGGGLCGVFSYGPPDPITAFNNNSKNFTVTCPGPTATTYLLVATGKGPMNNFDYSVDNLNNKVTVNVPAPWAGTGNTCWVTRPDGTCD